MKSEDNKREYDLSLLALEYSSKPCELPFFVIERLCAKLELAKQIFDRYDAEFKKPTCDTLVSPDTLEAVVSIMLCWNKEHQDFKVLNTLLRATEKYGIGGEAILSELARQRKVMLCRE